MDAKDKQEKRKIHIPLKNYWDLLSTHIKAQRGRFTLLSILLFGSIALQVINPQIVRYFIDAVTGGDTDANLLPAAIGFMAIAIIQQAVAVTATYTGENLAWTATNALRGELARHCLYLDMSFHNDTNPGQLIERIDGDVHELSLFFSQLVIRIIGNLILILGILIALTTVDWRIGGIFTLFAIC